MTLLDISLVTRALITLIERHVQASTIWPAGQTLSVVPDPPDRLSGDNTLGLYLYHLEEDPANRNMPPQGNAQPPVRYTPMPLLLYYQLSAHSDLDSPTGSYREQLMLGAALKTLHDFTVITDQTQIGGAPVFPAALIGAENRFQIELRPVSADESVNFWTAGSSPLRLACYYRVSVVMLAPEPHTRGAGPVLDYHIFPLPRTRPYITSSSNILEFSLPGESAPRRARLQPAQTPVGEAFQLHGTNFASDDTTIMLSCGAWRDPQPVDPMAWALQVSDERVSAVAVSPVNDLILVPGLYAVAVRTIRQVTPSGGGRYAAESLSNQCAITLLPRLDSVGAPDAAGRLEVTGHLFVHARIGADALQVFIGEQRLAQGDPGALNQAEFGVVDAGRLRIRLPLLPDGQSTVPLRIRINSAECAPHWIKLD